MNPESPAVLHDQTRVFSASDQFGPYQLKALIPEAEEIHMTAYRVQVRAHCQTPTSYHKKAEEIYWVLSGEAMMRTDDTWQEIRAGDFLRLPPGTRHAFKTGSQTLEMLNIHSPGSRPDRDVYFEEIPAPDQTT